MTSVKLAVEISLEDFFDSDNERSQVFQEALFTALMEKLREGQWVQSNIAHYLYENLLDEAFLSDAALGRYKESAIGGAFLGGAAGGLTGFGRSEQYRPPVQERDLTLTADQAPPADTGKIIELPNGRIINTGAAAPADVGLKKFVDETTGVIRPSRKGYEDQFKAAFNEPSGQYTSDPTTGIERELTVGEVFQRSAGLMDFTQDKPAETAAAETLKII